MKSRPAFAQEFRGKRVLITDCRLIGEIGGSPHATTPQALAKTVAYYRKELPHYL